MSNQITEVRLLSVPLENDYKHTLYFSSREEQTTYFLSRSVYSPIVEMTYQRKDGYIRYPMNIDLLDNCNYVMYKNRSDKWTYAFITSKEYKGDEVTWLYIETDVIQSYMFDYTVKPSFVEREHVDDDTEGKHTVPENLECGEYVCKWNMNIGELQTINIVVGVTDKGAKTDDLLGDYSDMILGAGGYFTGVYSGIEYLVFETTPEGIKDLQELISKEYKGNTDAIQVMFYAPSIITTRDTTFDALKDEGVENVRYLVQRVMKSEAPKTLSTQFGKNVGKYTPKNNKLNCYPYRYLLASNSNGASAIYQFEHFATEDGFLSFDLDCVLTPGCSIRITPKNYKGVDKNVEEGLNLGKYPILNWTSDEYTNWLTQNSVNIGLNLAAGLGQIVAGVATSIGTGGVGTAIGVGTIASGVSAIVGQAGQIHQMSFTPPQAHGNINCGDVITATHNNTFTFYAMNIKEEYMQIIDGFFNMFGYKVNTVKVPNVAHRENYWYTKTIDVSIDGNITNSDMQKIKNCYNSGITFWKNPANIGDYSVSNSIV